METEPATRPGPQGRATTGGWRLVATLCAVMLGLAGTLHLYQQRQLQQAQQSLADFSAVNNAVSVATAWLADAAGGDADAANDHATMALARIKPALARLGDDPQTAEKAEGNLPAFLDDLHQVRMLLARSAAQGGERSEAALPMLRRLDERAAQLEAAMRAEAGRSAARLDVAFVVAYGLALAALLAAAARVHAVQRRNQLAARQLRSSEARHRALVEALAEGVLVFDRDGHVETCNPAAEELLGRSAAAMRANDLADWVALDAGGNHPPAADLPVALVLQHGLSQRDITLGDVNPSGRIRWFSVNAEPLRDSATGRVSGAVVSFSDITERRRIEAELQASEATTRALMNSMADGVFVAQDYRCVYANEALLSMLGYASDEFAHLPFDQVVAPEMLAQTMSRFAQRLDDGAPPPPTSYELRLLMKDGVTELELELVASRVVYKGRPAVIGTLRDVTERKRAAEERALRALNAELTLARDKAEAAAGAKSAFLANMSHEIRTPMNAIIGLTHLLRREQPDPRIAERLVRIGDAAQHLMGIVNDILDLSKIEAGSLALEPTDFSMADLLERTCDLVAQPAHDKGLEMVIDAGGLPDALRGDPKRLSQALLNLLSNAVKFTETGSVSLSGRVQHREGDQVMLRFEVSDTGIGIAPHQLERVFSSFEQADASSTRRFGGAGLGLGITRHLARLMGGDAGALSQPGSGSLFWLTVQMRLSALPPPASAPDIRLVGKHALVVDDLPIAREVMLEMLHHLGLRTAAAASGAEARRLARDAELAGDPFEVALIDWLMPEMDGIATALHILSEARDDGPACIMVSTSDDGALRERALELGITSVLPKPVSLAALHRELAGLLLQRPPEAPTSHPDLHAERQLRRHHAGARVLVAEDNPVNQDVAVTLLQLAGLEVDVANNGREAVDMASHTHYAAILLDMQMPVLDGPNAARLLRARPATARTPIIAMTANAYASDRETCLAAGMNDHLTKPVDPPVLYETLLRWLGEAPVQPRAPSEAARQPTPLAAPAASAPPVAPTATALPELPAIEGIDTARGLAFVAGSREVYRLTLVRFAELYRAGLPAAAPYLAAPGEGQQAALKRELHSLGGACSAIGATDLREQCRELGELLGTGVPDPVAGERLRSLEAGLARLTTAIVGAPHQ